MRPNYLIFIGYLRKMRENQQNEPPHLYTYEPTLLKSWIRPCFISNLMNMSIGQRRVKETSIHITIHERK